MSFLEIPGMYTWQHCGYCQQEFVARVKFVIRGGAVYCSRGCSAKARNAARPTGASHSSLRRRARDLYIERHGEPICWCGMRPADVHHKDGDPWNNADSNHEALCRPHHIALENGLFPKRKRTRQVAVDVS